MCLVAQLCMTLVTLWTVALLAPLSMGILQARILEWVAIPSPRGSSRPGDGTPVSHNSLWSIFLQTMMGLAFSKVNRISY